MARPPRSNLSASAREIADAFEQAKQRVAAEEGRRLTQAEFAATALPATKSGKPQSARYLRLILEGKRNGAELLRRQGRVNKINVEVVSPSGDVRSITMRVPKGTRLNRIYETNIMHTVDQAESAWSKRYTEYQPGGKITNIRPVYGATRAKHVRILRHAS